MRVNGVTTTDPLWGLRFDRNGQGFGWRTTFSGVGDQFVTRSGFISRNGIVHANIAPNYSIYPKEGSLVQRVTGAITLDGIWQYQHFIHDGKIKDRKLHFDLNSALRGGWAVPGLALLACAGLASQASLASVLATLGLLLVGSGLYAWARRRA